MAEAVIGGVVVVLGIAVGFWLTRGGKYVPDALDRASDCTADALARGEAFEDAKDDDY